MFLNILDPVGKLSSIDLGAIPFWRLELIAFPSLTQVPVEGEVPAKTMLGLGLRYQFLGSASTQIIAAFDCEVDTVPEQVAAIGFPATTRSGNVARIREAMKAVINVASAKDATLLAQQAEKLANLYHDLLGALFNKAGGPLASLDAPFVGEFTDGEDPKPRVYRFAITLSRNQPWLAHEPSSGTGMGSAPGLTAPAVSKGGRRPVKGQKDKDGTDLVPPAADAGGGLPAL